MARLVGVDLPRDKRMEVALTYIFGMGRSRSTQTSPRPASTPTPSTRSGRRDEIVQLRDCIEGNYKVEGDLRREVAADIRRKVEIGCYEGIRHRRGLPVRGQRTRTNARTRKGPRTVAGKKKPARSKGPCDATVDASQDTAATSHGRRQEGAAQGTKNVAHGQAHIKSTFNNTIVSITDPTGAVISWAVRRPGRLQGLPQVDAVRRPDGRRGGRPARAWSTACARSTCS